MRSKSRCLALLRYLVAFVPTSDFPPERLSETWNSFSLCPRVLQAAVTLIKHTMQYNSRKTSLDLNIKPISNVLETRTLKDNSNLQEEIP